jgi:hypothetical protein
LFLDEARQKKSGWGNIDRTIDAAAPAAQQSQGRKHYRQRNGSPFRNHAGTICKLLLIATPILMNLTADFADYTDENTL